MNDFEIIYKKYFRDVFLYTKSLTKETDIAEEVVEETFFKAINSINQFEEKCDIRVWLCQIAKNTYFSYLKKHKINVSIDLVGEKPTDINIEQHFQDKEMAIKIHKILHNIQDPYKEVFSLRVFGELSFKQIAEVFGKNENWACVTYHRAKLKIKKEMEEL